MQSVPTVWKGNEDLLVASAVASPCQAVHILEEVDVLVNLIY